MSSFIPGVKTGDVRYERKQAKLISELSNLPNETLVNINLASFKSWIEERLSTLVGYNDEVLLEFVMNTLIDSQKVKKLIAGEMQLLLVPFMGKTQAEIFVNELWGWFQKAKSSPEGIPTDFALAYIKLLEKEKEELAAKNKTSFRGKDSGRQNEMQKSREPEGDKEKDIRRNNDNVRDRERYRDRSRDRSRDRNRDRSVDRSRDRSRDRQYSRRRASPKRYTRSPSRSRSRSRTPPRTRSPRRNRSPPRRLPPSPPRNVTIKSPQRRPATPPGSPYSSSSYSSSDADEAFVEPPLEDIQNEEELMAAKLRERVLRLMRQDD